MEAVVSVSLLLLFKFLRKSGHGEWKEGKNKNKINRLFSVFKIAFYCSIHSFRGHVIALVCSFIPQVKGKVEGEREGEAAAHETKKKGEKSTY